MRLAKAKLATVGRGQTSLRILLSDYTEGYRLRGKILNHGGGGGGSAGRAAAGGMDQMVTD